MFGSIAVLFALPWLDTSKVKSMRYRPVAKQFFFGFVVACLLLSWCGAENPDNPIIKMGDDKLVVNYTDAAGLEGSRVFEEYAPASQFREETVTAGGTASLGIQVAPAFRFLHLSQIMTLYYFAYFLIILPWLGFGASVRRVSQTLSTIPFLEMKRPRRRQRNKESPV